MLTDSRHLRVISFCLVFSYLFHDQLPDYNKSLVLASKVNSTLPVIACPFSACNGSTTYLFQYHHANWQRSRLQQVVPMVKHPLILHLHRLHPQTQILSARQTPKS